MHTAPYLNTIAGVEFFIPYRIGHSAADLPLAEKGMRFFGDDAKRSADQSRCGLTLSWSHVVLEQSEVSDCRQRQPTNQPNRRRRNGSFQTSSNGRTWTPM